MVPSWTPTLVPALKAELEKLGRSDIIVIVGGVVPKQDYEELYKAGPLIFGPGTILGQAASKIIEKLNDQFGHT